MEYVFCDTGEELPETKEYLDKLEVFLGKEINRLNPDRPFSHYLQVYNGVLPDARTRWCTRKLKIEPFEKFVKDDPCYSYIGIRADEAHRKGYISTKTNIFPRYPFIEDNIRKEDVFRILEESGLGLPKYYDWRSRSGCYFCFFQQRNEWVGLLENHPYLYTKALKFEKHNEETGENYTWSQNESLLDLQKPERVDEIKSDYKLKQTAEKKRKNLSLRDIFNSSDIQENDEGCLICHL
jgi:3'-phosphoadenosine 5'-phosphosulfate sulfotransferase (PAPS reductase)/FAD synthetase